MGKWAVLLRSLLNQERRLLSGYLIVVTVPLGPHAVRGPEVPGHYWQVMEVGLVESIALTSFLLWSLMSYSHALQILASFPNAN